MLYTSSPTKHESLSNISSVWLWSGSASPGFTTCTAGYMYCSSKQVFPNVKKSTGKQIICFASSQNYAVGVLAASSETSSIKRTAEALGSGTLCTVCSLCEHTDCNQETQALLRSKLHRAMPVLLDRDLRLPSLTDEVVERQFIKQLSDASHGNLGAVTPIKFVVTAQVQVRLRKSGKAQ